MAPTPEEVAQTVAKLQAQLLGPGGDFEIGVEEWLIGTPGSEARIQGPCFVKGPRTLRQFYDLCFLRVVETQLAPVRANCSSQEAKKTFIVYEAERYTYEQVWQQVSALAAQLAASGVKHGDRVAISMVSSAIDRTGLIIVPCSVTFPSGAWLSWPLQPSVPSVFL